MAKRNGTINWQTVADWIDTEGTISSVPSRKRNTWRSGAATNIIITQLERDPLERIKEFLKSQGKKGCAITEDRGTYRLICWKRGEVKRILDKIEPYLLTERKRRQLAKAREIYEKYPMR